MNQENEFALVPRPPGAVEKVRPGAKRILSGMVADTLALVKKEQEAATAPRFRIGEYEWCEPDYRQILIWAKALKLEPEVVIERLQNDESLRKENSADDFPIDFPSWAGTRFENGRMIGLHWDRHLLPLERFEWVKPTPRPAFLSDE